MAWMLSNALVTAVCDHCGFEEEVELVWFVLDGEECLGNKSDVVDYLRRIEGWVSGESGRLMCRLCVAGRTDDLDS